MVEGFSITVTIVDAISSPLRKLALKLPFYRQRLQSEYTRTAKAVAIQILNREFGSNNRLSRGTTIREGRGTEASQVIIKAEGKEGTRGAERLAVILNEGHTGHSIFPRKPKGVLSLQKGAGEGIVFRKFVRNHPIRPRKFAEKIQDTLERMFKGKAQVDVRKIKELRK